MKRFVVCLFWLSVFTLHVQGRGFSEDYRPLYHHAPAYGWMNDPNGLLYDERTQLWHLFYQHNPHDIVWKKSNMSWGHSVSRDLIHWTPCLEALSPNELGSIYSGSAIIDRSGAAGFGEGSLVAIYTQASEKGQIQSIAYSVDSGVSFTQFEQNPVLTAPYKDFRDPNVIWDEQREQWVMAIINGREVEFYASSDLKSWQKLSSFGEGRGNHVGTWECPNLFKIKVANTHEYKWVLLVSVGKGSPYSGMCTQYFIGDWNGTQFTSDQSDIRLIDYGRDFYAGVTYFNAPNERHVLIGWMSNWYYAEQTPSCHFRSVNTLPRDLTLRLNKDNRYELIVEPSPEVYQQKGQKIHQLSPASMIDIKLTNRATAKVILMNDQKEQVTIVFDRKNQEIIIDRSQSGQVAFHELFPRKVSAPLLGESGVFELFVDKCSLELFDKKAGRVISNLVFPNTSYTSISKKGCNVTMYQMNH